ncbi:ionotropic receptor 21a-like [Homarus americanus]|uniref:ionotropic receptor 21a-like n=1 Tax=Homarus americanus TaxID=6706 RepID=UPI001C4455D4|nr:ionotropic receptor 21a-like [Homarus americanus]
MRPHCPLLLLVLALITTTGVSLSDNNTGVFLSDVSYQHSRKICKLDSVIAGDRRRRAAAGHEDNYTTSLAVKEEGNSLIRNKTQRKMVSLWPVRDDEDLSNDGGSLGRLLVRVVEEEMRGCDLLLAYDDLDSHLPLLVHLLLLLPHTRQVLRVKTVEDLLGVVWVSPRCSSYLFLLQRPDHLMTFLNTHLDTWDYRGRYVLVGLSQDQLVNVSRSRKGKKTEHLLGVIKSGARGEWGVYMNQLYWGPGVQRVATWRGNSFTSQVELFPDKVSDLRGAVLKVCTFVWEPNVFYYRAKNGSLLYRYGIDIQITRLLARSLNFSIEFVEPPPGEMWGEAQTNGYFSGLIGKVKRDEVDIGVADLYLVISRNNIVDMTSPYDSEMKCFLVLEAPPLPRWQALVFPLNPWTWLASFLSLLLSGPLLWVFASVSNRCGGEVNILQHLTPAWQYAFGLHFRQAQASVPRSTSTQVVVTALWLYTIILTIVYSSNLTAFLLVRKQPPPMDTIIDLYHSGLELATIGVFFKNAMAISSDPYLRALTKMFVSYDDVEDILARVVAGEAVYLSNGRYIQFVTTTRFTKAGTRVRVMKECFSTFYNAVALQRYSPLTPKFNQIIGWISQNGLVHHYLRESIRLAASTEEYGGGGSVSDGGGNKQNNSPDNTNATTPLSLDHLQGIFFVIIFGWVSSSLAFCLEVIMYGRRSERASLKS